MKTVFSNLLVLYIKADKSVCQMTKFKCKMYIAFNVYQTSNIPSYLSLFIQTTQFMKPHKHEIEQQCISKEN